MNMRFPSGTVASASARVGIFSPLPLFALQATGIQLAEFCQRGVGDLFVHACCPLRRGIVDHHNLAVPGQVDIEFIGIRVLFPAELERGHGIFRCIVGCATVADDFDGMS
jgi:hypothetical protein